LHLCISLIEILDLCSLATDVKIGPFPESEFGSIKGNWWRLVSDALAPTQERPFYAFPAKNSVDSQSLLTNGRKLPLQSGMSTLQ